uniref:Glycosyltransferase family 28 N-terminal domain-containing protein n=1 Tax=Pyrodinium bahamense TaxID=73915 RepID=A0A7S0AT16_9DINO
MERAMVIIWGSRGDVQPALALALRLKQMGRSVLMFATPPATDMVKAKGIECVEARENVEKVIGELFGKIDPTDRSICGIVKQLKTASAFQQSEEYTGNQAADMSCAWAEAQKFKPDVILAPNIMYGPYVSIAEALQVPVVTFDLQLNYPTSELPYMKMEVDKAPKCCYRCIWRLAGFAISKKERPNYIKMRETCGLPSNTHVDGSSIKIFPHDLPQICACSPSFISSPHDWPLTKYMSGWWFFPPTEGYTPPPQLEAFLQANRPVYIGFGSMKGNPDFCRKCSTFAIKGLMLAGQKGVLLGGWAGLSREALDMSSDEGRQLHAWAEENVAEVDSCPHDWLFPQCAVVIHHGGVGTLAAGIRAGCPTIVCAYQGDQPFHGSIAQAKGIGKYLGMVGTIPAEKLADAIKEVVADKAMAATVKAMGEMVRAEDGPGNAIAFMDRMATSFQYPWPTKRQ